MYKRQGYDTRAALLCGTEMEIAPISEPWAGTAQISYLTYGDVYKRQDLSLYVAKNTTAIPETITQMAEDTCLLYTSRCV